MHGGAWRAAVRGVTCPSVDAGGWREMGLEAINVEFFFLIKNKFKNYFYKMVGRDFPGDRIVKTSPSRAGG